MIEQHLKKADHLIRFKAYEAKNTFLHHWEIEDLEQEGRLAAIKAYQRYKEDKDVLFTTFIFPYLTRTYLSIYAYETCSKRSMKKQVLEDLKLAEGTENMSFPSHDRRGTIYNLDRIFQRNDALSDWNEQPVLQEPELHSPPVSEKYEVQDLFEKLYKKVDALSKQILDLLVTPPKEFVLQGIERDRYSTTDYCEYLHVSQYKFNQAIKDIKKAVRKLSER